MRNYHLTNKELKQDEAEEMLLRLTDLTSTGKIQWSCLQYSPIEPISLYPVDDEPGRLAFAHRFQLQSDYRSANFSVDATELFCLPECSSEIRLAVTRSHQQIAAPFVCSGFQASHTKALLDAALLQLRDERSLSDSFQNARFDDMRGNVLFRDHPAYRAVKSLFLARDAWGFHKFVCEKLI